ncbi:MAG: hypothetical protein LBV12_08835 [Puniceicoccales bacterium]|nr:hypothetical protein [Puniceicoccales bacterium]
MRKAEEILVRIRADLTELTQEVERLRPGWSHVIISISSDDPVPTILAKKTPNQREFSSNSYIGDTIAEAIAATDIGMAL